MDDLSEFKRKKQYGMRERGARSNFTLTGGGVPIGGSDNPGQSIGDMYDKYYINKNEIPPQHNLINKLDSIKILRKKKIASKRKSCIDIWNRVIKTKGKIPSKCIIGERPTKEYIKKKCSCKKK